MKKIRVAIAGLGRLGRVHAENLAFRIPNAELCAVCAQTADSLNWARERLDISACYQDFGEMLTKETPDAVVLVTPSDLHCEQIEQALIGSPYLISAIAGRFDQKLAWLNHARLAQMAGDVCTIICGRIRAMDRSGGKAEE